MVTEILFREMKMFWNYKLNILKVTELCRKRKKSKYQNGILLSHEKERGPDTHYSVDGP